MKAFYILVALQVLDLVSTVIALRNPALKEANGPLAKLMQAVGTLPALVCVKTTAMVLLWWHQAELGVALPMLCVAYAVVVANNVRLIRKAKQTSQPTKDAP